MANCNCCWCEFHENEIDGEVWLVCIHETKYALKDANARS